MNDLIVVEKIAGWEKLKALVLDSVSSPITKRVYNMALNEFMAWFQQAPRAGDIQRAPEDDPEIEMSLFVSDPAIAARSIQVYVGA